MSGFKAVPVSSQIRFKKPGVNYRGIFIAFSTPGTRLIRRTSSLLLSVKPKNSFEITAQEFERAADAINLDIFGNPNAKKVAAHIKENLRSGNLTMLKYQEAAKATSNGCIYAFKRELGVRDYYVGMALLIPSDVREKVLEGLSLLLGRAWIVRSILQESKYYKKIVSEKTPVNPSKARFEKAAAAIDPRVFQSYPRVMDLVQYIKDAIRERNLGLLARKKVERFLKDTVTVNNFTRMCIPKGSYFYALASLVEDREVMVAILNECNYTKEREQILEMCGKFGGVALDPKIPKDRKNDKVENKILVWAKERFGGVVEEVKRAGEDVTKEQLRKLTWKYAIVFYERAELPRLPKFCKAFGGVRGRDGWYLALKKVFGLSEELITKIMSLDS